VTSADQLRTLPMVALQTALSAWRTAARHAADHIALPLFVAYGVPLVARAAQQVAQRDHTLAHAA
jgi:hypothetical protein